MPSELGSIDQRVQGKNGKIVIQIQDAHAVPDAQKSIQRLIEHFQTQYGVKTVAVEGAEGRQDPTLFRTCPDGKIMRAIFEKYLESGELSGAAAASVINTEKANYWGVEDWNLYETGIAAYRDAAKQTGQESEKLEEYGQTIQKLKTKYYSADARRLDGKIAAWEESSRELLPLMRDLIGIKVPDERKYPLISAFAEALRENRFDDRDKIVSALAGLAERISTEIKDQDELASYNRIWQDYRTGQMSAGAFVSYLTRFDRQNETLLRMQRVLGWQILLETTAGFGFHQELSDFMREVKDTVLKSGDEKRIEALDRELQGLKHLIRLEMTKAEWNEISAQRKGEEESEINGRQFVSVQDAISDFESDLTAYRAKLISGPNPFIRFYETAVMRDRVFTENIARILKDETTNAVILVTGGFHVDGLAGFFEKEGYSYLRVTPVIGRLPEKSRYLDYMHGQVSWRDYFRVKEGRINLFAAFSRAVIAQIVNATKNSAGKNADRMMFEGEPNRLLLAWRDQLIRELADQKRIEQAPKFTAALDEAFIRTVDRSTLEELRKKWLQKLDRFVGRLRALEKHKQIDESHLTQLLSQTQSSFYCAFPFNFETTIPSELAVREAATRSEMRHSSGPKLEINDHMPVWNFLRAFGIDPARDRIRDVGEGFGVIQVPPERVSKESVMRLFMFKSYLFNLQMKAFLAFNGSNDLPGEFSLLTYRGRPSALLWSIRGPGGGTIYYSFFGAMQDYFFTSIYPDRTVPSPSDPGFRRHPAEFTKRHYPVPLCDLLDNPDHDDSFSTPMIHRGGTRWKSEETLAGRPEQFSFSYPSIYMPGEASTKTLLAVFDQIDFSGQSVVEIGSGNGRLVVDTLRRGASEGTAYETSSLGMENTSAWAVMNGVQTRLQVLKDDFEGSYRPADIYLFNSPNVGESLQGEESRIYPDYDEARGSNLRISPAAFRSVIRRTMQSARPDSRFYLRVNLTNEKLSALLSDCGCTVRREMRSQTASEIDTQGFVYELIRSRSEMRWNEYVRTVHQRIDEVEAGLANILERPFMMHYSGFNFHPDNRAPDVLTDLMDAIDFETLANNYRARFGDLTIPAVVSRTGKLLTQRQKRLPDFVAVRYSPMRVPCRGFLFFYEPDNVAQFHALTEEHGGVNRIPADVPVWTLPDGVLAVNLKLGMQPDGVLMIERSLFPALNPELVRSETRRDATAVRLSGRQARSHGAIQQERSEIRKGDRADDEYQYESSLKFDWRPGGILEFQIGRQVYELDGPADILWENSDGPPLTVETAFLSYLNPIVSFISSAGASLNAVNTDILLKMVYHRDEIEIRLGAPGSPSVPHNTLEFKLDLKEGRLAEMPETFRALHRDEAVFQAVLALAFLPAVADRRKPPESKAALLLYHRSQLQDRLAFLSRRDWFDARSEMRKQTKNDDSVRNELIQETIAKMVQSGLRIDERLTAALVLGEIGSVRAVPALVRMLQSNNELLRINAAIALGEIGPEALAVEPELIELIRRAKVPVSDKVWVIGEMGTAAAGLVPAIQEVVKKSQDDELTQCAQAALLKITPLRLLREAVKREVLRSLAVHQGNLIRAMVPLGMKQEGMQSTMKRLGLPHTIPDAQARFEQAKQILTSEFGENLEEIERMPVMPVAFVESREMLKALIVNGGSIPKAKVALGVSTNMVVDRLRVLGVTVEKGKEQDRFKQSRERLGSVITQSLRSTEKRFPWGKNAGDDQGLDDFPAELRPKLRAAGSFLERALVLAGHVGMDRTDLAAEAGFNAQVFRKWDPERVEATSEPSPEAIKAVSEALHCSAYFLLTLKPKREALKAGPKRRRLDLMLRAKGISMKEFSRRLGSGNSTAYGMLTAKRKYKRYVLFEAAEVVGESPVAIETGYMPDPKLPLLVKPHGRTGIERKGAGVLAIRDLHRALMKEWKTTRPNDASRWGREIRPDRRGRHPGLAARLLRAEKGTLEQAVYYGLIPKTVAMKLQQRFELDSQDIQGLAASLAKAHDELVELFADEHAPQLCPPKGYSQEVRMRYSWDLIARFINRARLLKLLEAAPVNTQIFKNRVLQHNSNPEREIARRENKILRLSQNSQLRDLSTETIRIAVWTRGSHVEPMLLEAARQARAKKQADSAAIGDGQTAGEVTGDAQTSDARSEVRPPITTRNPLEQRKIIRRLAVLGFRDLLLTEIVRRIHRDKHDPMIRFIWEQLEGTKQLPNFREYFEQYQEGRSMIERREYPQAVRIFERLALLEIIFNRFGIQLTPDQDNKIFIGATVTHPRFRAGDRWLPMRVRDFYHDAFERNISVTLEAQASGAVRIGSSGREYSRMVAGDTVRLDDPEDIRRLNFSPTLPDVSEQLQNIVDTLREWNEANRAPRILSAAEARRELVAQMQSDQMDDPIGGSSPNERGWNNFTSEIDVSKSGSVSMKFKRLVPDGTERRVMKAFKADFPLCEPVEAPFKATFRRIYDPALFYHLFEFVFTVRGERRRKVFRVKRDDALHPLFNETNPIEVIRNYPRLVLDRGMVTAYRSVDEQLSSQEAVSSNWPSLEMRTETDNAGKSPLKFGLHHQRVVNFILPPRTVVSISRAFRPEFGTQVFSAVPLAHEKKTGWVVDWNTAIPLPKALRVVQEAGDVSLPVTRLDAPNQQKLRQFVMFHGGTPSAEESRLSVLPKTKVKTASNGQVQFRWLAEGVRKRRITATFKTGIKKGYALISGAVDANDGVFYYESEPVPRAVGRKPDGQTTMAPVRAKGPHRFHKVRRAPDGRVDTSKDLIQLYDPRVRAFPEMYKVRDLMRTQLRSPDPAAEGFEDFNRLVPLSANGEWVVDFGNRRHAVLSTGLQRKGRAYVGRRRDPRTGKYIFRTVRVLPNGDIETGAEGKPLRIYHEMNLDDQGQPTGTVFHQIDYQGDVWAEQRSETRRAATAARLSGRQVRMSGTPTGRSEARARIYQELQTIVRNMDGEILQDRDIYHMVGAEVFRRDITEILFDRNPFMEPGQYEMIRTGVTYFLESELRRRCRLVRPYELIGFLAVTDRVQTRRVMHELFKDAVQQLKLKIPKERHGHIVSDYRRVLRERVGDHPVLEELEQALPGIENAFGFHIPKKWRDVFIAALIQELHQPGSPLFGVGVRMNSGLAMLGDALLDEWAMMYFYRTIRSKDFEGIDQRRLRDEFERTVNNNTLAQIADRTGLWRHIQSHRLKRTSFKRFSIPDRKHVMGDAVEAILAAAYLVNRRWIVFADAARHVFAGAFDVKPFRHAAVVEQIYSLGTFSLERMYASRFTRKSVETDAGLIQHIRDSIEYAKFLIDCDLPNGRQHGVPLDMPRLEGVLNEAADAIQELIRRTGPEHPAVLEESTYLVAAYRQLAAIHREKWRRNKANMQFLMRSEDLLRRCAQHVQPLMTVADSFTPELRGQVHMLRQELRTAAAFYADQDTVADWARSIELTESTAQVMGQRNQMMMSMLVRDLLILSRSLVRHSDCEQSKKALTVTLELLKRPHQPIVETSARQEIYETFRGLILGYQKMNNRKEAVLVAKMANQLHEAFPGILPLRDCARLCSLVAVRSEIRPERRSESY
ncbi:MAG: ribonuclease III domain-containing protein, partial [Candidatus Omnitrophica bacterium]|nr:ribonuclease III domain-containing protein [Candidatus Omnitrophota bacterium]